MHSGDIRIISYRFLSIFQRGLLFQPSGVEKKGDFVTLTHKHNRCATLLGAFCVEVVITI